MSPCQISPSDKRGFGVAVGHDLAQVYGKKPYYTPEQVKRSTQRSGYPVDWDCWAMCLYVSPSDFSAYHESIGEVCNYGEMKSSMTAAITEGVSSSWFDIDMSWLDWPDIDLSVLFDLDIFG